MKIYYRGYIINGDKAQDSGYMVQGMRPERKTLTLQDNPRAAMRWIDRDVTRQKVQEAGWLWPRAVSV